MNIFNFLFGGVNSAMHASLSKFAQEYARWASDSYQQIKSRNPNLEDREIFGMMLDLRGRFPGGDSARQVVLDRYGTSIHGIAYFVSLNSQELKGLMVIRCLNFIEYLDIELKKRGHATPSHEQRCKYYNHLKLPPPDQA